MNDSISDLFTRLRNASLVGHDKVHVPWTKMNERFIQILLQQGFVLSYQIVPKFSKANKASSLTRLAAKAPKTLVITLKYKVGRSIITQIRRLSRPGCRIYVQSRQIPNLLRSLKALGTPIAPLLFLSTSQGILSDREARVLNIGGEVLGIVS